MRIGPCPRAAVLLLAFVLVSGPAVAQPAQWTEREAREAGRRLLREGKFPEAIAAFAQSAKCWPCPRPHEYARDPRTGILERAFDEVWRDLEQSGTPEADRLPYADFYVAHFPFFDTDLHQSVDRWVRMILLAAEIRMRLADPRGNDPRFDRCRLLAGLSGVEGGEKVLTLIESPDWPAPHEDFGACALRAARLLDARVRKEEHGWDTRFLHRAWLAYARRFSDARCFGWAMDLLSQESEAEERATDPVVLRWRRIRRARDCYEPEEASVAFARLAEVSAPWVTPALAEAWTMALRAGRAADEPAQRGEMIAAWRRMKDRFAGTPEFGMASFAVLWSDSHWFWHERSESQQDFLREWAAAAPEDPFLPWARLALIENLLERDGTAVLSDSEREDLTGMTRRFPSESIAAAAQLALAEDEVRRGQGDRARQRYEEVAKFDPEGVRLPAAGDPRDAVGAAREKLVVYFRSRNPRRVPEFSGNRIFSESPHMPDGEICGNAVQTSIESDERRQAARLVEAGLVEAALEEYWAGLSTPGVNGPDEEAALAFADLCVAAGRRDRITSAVAALRAIQEEENRKHPKYSEQGCAAQARRLEEYCAVLDAAPVEGAAGIARRLTTILAGVPPYSLDRVPSLDGVLRAARHSPRVIAEVPSHLSVPATPVSLLLARLAPGPETLAYALDVCLAAAPEEPGEPRSAYVRLARKVLLADPAAALRVILERVRTDGPALWERMRSVVAGFPLDARWSTFRGFRDDPDAAVRDLARLEMGQMRRADPWRVYCLGSE